MTVSDSSEELIPAGSAARQDFTTDGLGGAFCFDASAPQPDHGFGGERTGGFASVIGVGCFEFADAHAAVFGGGDFTGEAADGLWAALTGFEGENPRDHLSDFVRGVLWVGEHGDLAPDALAAVADALDGCFEGSGLATVFRGDFGEGRTDDFLVNGVAVEAIALAHEGEAGIHALFVVGVLEPTGIDHGFQPHHGGGGGIF